MLQVHYEGTPVGTIPVANDGTYWEAGAMGMLNANGAGTVSNGTAVYGILADRRSLYPGISIATFLPTASSTDFGDESLFNQPGHGNSLYNTTTETLSSSVQETINNVIPINTIPTTTLLVNETSVNPNTNSRYVTMYTRGGNYGTDQYDTTKTYYTGQTLYCMQDGTGRVTNTSAGLSNAVTVGVVECSYNLGGNVSAIDGNGFLQFKFTIV
jgi:hypothetical protein